MEVLHYSEVAPTSSDWFKPQTFRPGSNIIMTFRLNVDRFFGSIAVVVITDILYFHTSQKKEHKYGSSECNVELTLL